LPMADAHDSSTPLLDAWIAEKGEEAVAATIEDARRRATEGTLPAFDNASDLTAYMRQHRRQSA
jgi:hypothetical protein